MTKRDLKADLEAIRAGVTLFNDPNPGVNTQYELYEVAEHAIERAIKAEKALGNETILNGKALAKLNERAERAEALARELVEVLEHFETVGIDDSLKERIEDTKRAQTALVKAKEVLGDVE